MKSRFKRVNQPDTWSCMACVGAMITGMTLEETLKVILNIDSTYEGDEPISFEDLERFLLSNGWHIGMLIDLHTVFLEDDEIKSIKVEISLKDPAIVEVKSTRLPGKTHVVLWTGKEILDSNPNMKGKRKLYEYDINQWWPLLELVNEVSSKLPKNS